MISDNRIHPLEEYQDILDDETLMQLFRWMEEGISVRIFHSDFGDVDFLFEKGDRGFQWPIADEFDEEFEEIMGLLKLVV